MSDNDLNTRIKKLSPLLINQLAAGEVVTRPAAVVKELLENAIDAGATSIEVHITQGGMGMIEVVDNGDGIHPDDMVMAITRHATSKVADIANLHGISTLGFRGEALAATAAVSRLTLISSHDDSGIGRQLQVAGVLADVPKLIPVVQNRGTTVTVKDLYFNVPARRGNLKSIATEFTHIETVVREVALARADVTLCLFHDHKKRLMLSAISADSTGHHKSDYLPLSRLEQALGVPLVDNAVEVIVDLSSLLQPLDATSNHLDQQANISGWLWPINDANQVPQAVLPKLLYVNGRLVKEALISNQLRQLAHSAELDSIGYALYFKLPYHWLNINVHPSKQRIKISPLNNVMAHLSHVIGIKLKSITTTQVSASATPLRQYSNRVPLLKESSHIGTSIGSLPQRQQVQAPKQQYSIAHSSKYISANSISDVNQVSSADNEGSDFTCSKALPTDRYIHLPQCLQVITHLPAPCQSTSSLALNNDSTPLPWLLFYAQGQLMLISVTEWRQYWLDLTGNDLLRAEGFKDDQVASINTQMNTYATGVPQQKGVACKTAIEYLLSTRNIATIDSEQLLTLMLSSTPV